MKRMLLLVALVLLPVIALAQSADKPFLPMGATTNVAVTGTAATLTLPSNPFPGSQWQVVLTCAGTQTCFFRNDGVTATVSNAMPVIANGQFIVSLTAATTTLSVIASTTGSTLYATAGLGL